MKKIYSILILLFVSIFCSAQVVQLSNFSGGSRQGAVSVSLGDYGYVGLGNNGSTYYKDFWKYNPTNDSWTELTSFPGEARNSAVAFVIADFIYVGSGSKYAGTTTFYSDFYKYSPADDEWTAIASFGGGERTSAVAFVIDNYAYVGTGGSPSGDKKDFWKYDPTEDAWSQVASSPDEKKMAMGFSFNGKGYLVAGVTYSPYTNSFSDVQEYNPSTNTWTERVFADGLNLTFTEAAVFVLDGLAYIAYGNHDFVTTYNPQNNQRKNLGNFFELGTKRNSPCSFVINGIVYFGLGSWFNSGTFSDEYSDQFLKYAPPLPEPSVLTLSGGGSYCEGTTPTGITAQIAGTQSRISYQLKKSGVDFGDAIEGNGGTITWNDLPIGSYTAVASNGETNVNMNGTVTVQEVAPSQATIEISADQLSVCENQGVMVTANTTNGGQTPSYKWILNDVVQSGSYQTFNFEPANNDKLVCELTSNKMCVTNSPVLSNELTFETIAVVDVSVEISAESLEACSGTQITVTANPVNGGESPIFIWTVNSQNQNNNSTTLVYTPSNGDKVICKLVSDIACPSETMVSSNELVIVVNNCSTVDINQLKSLLVYPNPVQSKLTIESIDGDRISAIKVLSLDGKELINLDYSHKNFIETIDLSHLHKGVYVLVIQGEKGLKTVRIAKE